MSMPCCNRISDRRLVYPIGATHPALIFIFAALVSCSNEANVDVPYTQLQYLFRVSQGSSSHYPPGLWGGEMDPSGDGVGGDLFRYGYDTSVSERVQSEYLSQSLTIHSVSYDESTEEAMLVMEDSAGSHTNGLSAVAGPLCAPDEGKIRLLFTHAELHSHPDHPFLFDVECGSKCGWGPFAYYHGEVYFILSAVFGRFPSLLTRRIELRRLVKCDGNGELVWPLEQFNILDCSEQLALLSSEPYKKPHPKVSVWPAHSLKAANVEGTDVFFVQLLDTSIEESMIQLIAIQPENNVNEALYTRPIADRYTSSAYVQGFGSIDYKDGFLCWTATDVLLCASYAPSYNLDYMMFLSRGEAVNHSVCTGSMPTVELQNALTGVAIAETASRLAVYFGCYAEIRGVGGVGLVRITSHGLVKEVFAVRSGNRKVFGGSVFLTTTVAQDCHSGSSPNPSSTTPWPHQGSTSPVSGSVALLPYFFIVFLLFCVQCAIFE